MNKVKYLAVLLSISFAFILIIAACKHEPNIRPSANGKGSTTTTTGNGSGGNDTTTTVADTSICFERDVLPIFVTNCVRSGCHDAATAAEGYVLDNYADITRRGIAAGNATSSKLYRVLLAGGDDLMPQGGPALSGDQIAIIKKWIDQGAVNGTNCAVTCDTGNYTYSTGVKPILSTYCLGCHSSSVASSAGGGFILDNYTSVKTVAMNGMLVGVLTSGSGYPSMPLSGTHLTNCQVIQVKKWVNAGAPNN